MTVEGRTLLAGSATGVLLKLDAPLSFWGGVDPETGTIIDRSHPQHGLRLGGRVVALPGTKGSSGTPGVLGDALRRGTGPAAILTIRADANLAAGAIVAAALYGVECPILEISATTFSELRTGEVLTINAA